MVRTVDEATVTISDRDVDDVRVVVEAAWCNSLRLEHLEGDGNFFALGGDSLAGMALIGEIQDRLGITVTFADLLDAPTVDAFVALLPTLKRGPAPARRHRRRARSTAPMTRLQAFRWKGRRHPVPGAEVSWLYRIDGRLNVDALCGAVDELVRRHEILRTTFGRRRGRPRQIVRAWRPGYVRIVDMTHVAKRQREVESLQLLVDEDYRAFDYRRGPLIRPTLVKLDDTCHLFSLACCEMVVDGSSRRIVATSLTTLYEMLDIGKDADDYPYPATQFGSFAAARRDLVGGSQYLEQVAYWRERLRSVDPLIPVEGLGDGSNGEVKTVNRTLQLPAGAVERVEATARALATTPFSVLNAAFAALLATLGEADPLVYTTTLAHRDVVGAEDLIGSFYNNVFLSVDIRDVDDGAGLVEAAAAAARESFRYGEVPLQAAEGFLPKPDDNRRGLRVGSVRFQLHEYPGEIRLGSLRMQKVRLPMTGGPDLGILATRTASGVLELDLLCKSELPRRLLDDLLPAYRRVLSALTHDPAAPLDELLRAGVRPPPRVSRR